MISHECMVWTKHKKFNYNTGILIYFSNHMKEKKAPLYFSPWCSVYRHPPKGWGAQVAPPPPPPPPPPALCSAVCWFGGSVSLHCWRDPLPSLSTPSTPPLGSVAIKAPAYNQGMVQVDLAPMEGSLWPSDLYPF